MANKYPLKYDKPFTIRVDEAFFEKLDELRVSERPPKTRSDYVRKLVEDAEPAKRSARR